LLMCFIKVKKINMTWVIDPTKSNNLFLFNYMI
jgi:hypothetical protein